MSPLGLLPCNPLPEAQVPGSRGGSSTGGPFWIQPGRRGAAGVTGMAKRDRGRKKAKKSSSASCLATLAVCGVIFPLVWLPEPSGLDAQDGVAHPLGVTFTCTKGWSLGAPSRTTAGKRCRPGELGMGGGGAARRRVPAEDERAQGPVASSCSLGSVAWHSRLCSIRPSPHTASVPLPLKRLPSAFPWAASTLQTLDHACRPSCLDWPPIPSAALPTRAACDHFAHPALMAGLPQPDRVP